MAILRASELREKDEAELETNLNDLRKKLMKIRGGLASGGIPEDVGKTREIKKTIARILTIKHERTLGLKKEVKVKQKTEEKKEKAEKPAEVKEKPKSESSKKTVKAKKTKEVNKKK